MIDITKRDTFDQRPKDIFVEPDDTDWENNKEVLLGPNSFMSGSLLQTDASGLAPPPNYTKYE